MANDLSSRDDAGEGNDLMQVGRGEGRSSFVGEGDGGKSSCL